MCNDIALLPEALRARSVSQTEIVLPYPEILEAIDHIARQGHAFLGWEGWLRYADWRSGLTETDAADALGAAQRGDTHAGGASQSQRRCSG